MSEEVANVTALEDFVISTAAGVGISVGSACCLCCLCCNIWFIWTRKVNYDKDFKERLWRVNPDSPEWIGELPPGFASTRPPRHGLMSYLPWFMRSSHREYELFGEPPTEAIDVEAAAVTATTTTTAAAPAPASSAEEVERIGNFAWVTRLYASRMASASRPDPPPQPAAAAGSSSEHAAAGPHPPPHAAHHARVLNMDNIKITFRDYLWAWYFVGPNAVALWAVGVSRMLFRARRARCGCCAKAMATMSRDGQREGPRVPYTPERLVAKLCLEGLQVVRYDHLEDLPNGDVEGTFLWWNLPYLANDPASEAMGGSLVRAHRLKIVLTLSKGGGAGGGPPEMARAYLKMEDDGQDESEDADADAISANQAMILVWFDTIFAFHVKMHSYANWAVNVRNTSQAYGPPGGAREYARRASAITVMYNYFGYTIFPFLAKFWHDIGCTRYSWYNLKLVISAGVSDGLRPHYAKRLHEIAKYSKVCDFIGKLRLEFLRMTTDAQYGFATLFPEVNGDALFIGTAMHSLDHTNMAWNMEDYLWLDVDDPRFGHLAEVGRFVRAGFVDDLPCVCWPRKFRRAPHPFFQAVYRKALALNPTLARHMDTAIIK